MADSDQSWHAQTSKEVLSGLRTRKTGLSQAEASKRLEEFGPNKIQRAKKTNAILMFLNQFTDFLVLVLIASAGISAFLGHINDAFVIGIIIILNAIMGFIQEYRAEKAIEALMKLVAHYALVMRDGKRKKIPANELVPGDIVLLNAGDMIPVDCRIIKAIDLRINEAPLTGESIPARKSEEVIETDVSLPDMSNIAWMGTNVIWGRAEAVCIATGMDTEMGKIAKMVESSRETTTPLKIKLQEFGYKLGMVILGISGVILLVGVLRGNPLLDMFITAVSLAVAAIPEGLPAVVTITLALGVQKMAKKNAIVRKLPAVETLGCTTLICSDKTGTLTRNEMSVSDIWVNGEMVEVTGVGFTPRGEFSKDPKAGELELLLRIGALCNNAELQKTDKGWELIGDATEGALLVAATKAGLSYKNKYPRIDEIPFDPGRKMMTTIHIVPSGRVAYVKGAPEIVLSKCTHIIQKGKVKKLTPKTRKKILKVNRIMAKRALRVLAFAWRKLPKTYEPSEVEEKLVFVGLQGMIDLPKPEVKDAIKICRDAGIEVIMITGDHKSTALAIAEKLGLAKSGDKVLTGADLKKMSDQELELKVEEVAVYARSAPEDKIRIVQALRRKGHVVAVTGDGVNDAPALKEAEIGVSMGITGTDVSKEASDMVLADDNFATIVIAVKEGRRIYDNIKKFIRYLLSANFAEVLTIFGATLTDLPLPLLPMQILWINLVTDGLPALALGIDPALPNLMKQKPRPKDETILNIKTFQNLLVIGLVGCAVTLAIFYWELPGGLEKARTMAFTTLMMFEMAVVFTCRSETIPFLRVGIFSNPWLIIAVAVSILLQLMVLYVPFLQNAFGVTALSSSDWVKILLLSSVVFIAEETRKLKIAWDSGSRRWV